MTLHTDVSYGIIPVRQTDAGWEVLLIYQHSKIAKNSYWTFPKGHPESVETPWQTAARELQEETGYGLFRLLSEQAFVSRYSFHAGSKTIQKTAIFFLGEVTESATNPLENGEVLDVRWCRPEQVGELLEHAETRQLFESAREILHRT